MADSMSALLLYDADCGACTRFKKAMDFLDAHERIGFMSIDRAEQIGLLNAIPDARRHRSFHMVLADGRLESGATALPSLIGLLPCGRFIAKMVCSAPKGLSVLAFVYSTASRLHETGSCKVNSAAGGEGNRADRTPVNSAALPPFL